MPFIRVVFLLGVLAFTARSAHAQDGLLKDANGDPLPPGAFSRLGSTRFRVTDPVLKARFVDGGKKLLLRVQQPSTFIDNQGEGAFRLLNPENGLDLGQVAVGLNRILGHFSYSSSAHPLVTEGIGFPDWCISSDATMIANVDVWGSLKVRELATGKTVCEIATDKSGFAFAQFSPDGKQIAAVARQTHEGGKKNQGPPIVICLLQVQNGKEIRRFLPPVQPNETFQAHWLSFSPDGAYLAATGFEEGKAGIVRVWDVAGKKPSWQVDGESEKRSLARSIAFSPDSKSLAAAADGKISLWDPSSGKRIKDVANFNDRCATLDWSPDGTLVIACAGHETVNPGAPRMWPVSNGQEINLPVKAIKAYVFSENGKTLVLADANEDKLVVCDAATGQIQAKIVTGIPKNSNEDVEHLFYKARQGMGWPFALSPNGKTLVAADKPGQLRRFEVATGKSIPPPGLATDLATALAFTPDGKKLLAAGQQRVLLHDTDGTTPAFEFSVPSLDPAKSGRGAELPKPTVIAFSRDGLRAAAGWDNGIVGVWDTKTGKLQWQSHEHDWQVVWLAFEPDDQTLISTGNDGQVIWWVALTGQRQRKLACDGDKEYYNRGHFVLGPLGLTALYYGRKNWQEWELFSGKMRREIKDAGTPVAFSSDGFFVLVGGPTAFQLVERNSEAVLRSFGFAFTKTSIYNPQASACFSHDNRTIAGIADQSAARIYDRDTATLLATLNGHKGGVLALAFAPDDKTLATSSGDGTIFLWRTSLKHVAAAKEKPSWAPKLPAAAKDSDGEPLPSGATARLGLLRFQNGLPVASLRYTPEGKSILVQTDSSDDGWIDIALWDAASGKLKGQMEVTYVHRGGFTGIPHGDFWTVSDDGKFLATCNTYLGRAVEGLLPALCVKDICTGKVLFQGGNADSSGPMRFSPDSKSMLRLNDMTLIDLATGRERKLTQTAKKWQPLDAWFSPNGKTLLALDWAGTISSWDLGRVAVPKLL